MPDEQIIYLDPNDELTMVREKIEQVPARRIVMVVPQQTQLRSNVGWRLLHARARALGKEVQVISPDRQVRAVAKAAGFRVSQPQEGSSTSKMRVPPTQPPPSQRGVTERRGVQRQRGPVNRGQVDNRAARQREALPPPPVREEPPPTIPQPETRPPQSTWRQQENPPTRPEEPGERTSRQGKEEAFPSEEIFEDDALDQPFEFRIDQAQGELHTARPLIARPEEEEHQDPFIPDYDTSRRIREAAREGASGSESNPPRRDEDPTSAFSPSRYSTPPEPIRTNPFEDDIEELSPSNIPEQRGATFAPDMHDLAPDVADIPTDVHKIEDVDEPDNFPVRQWDNEFLNEPDESLPASTSDRRARGSRRSGKLQRSPDEDDEDYLPPAGQSTLIRANRPVPSGSLGTPRAGSRGAQMPPPLPAEPQPLTRNVSTRPIAQSPRPQQPPAQPRPITRDRIAAAPPPSPPRPPRRSNQVSRRRGRVTTAVVVIVLVLLLLVGVGFFYYGTSATVTLTVPSKTLSLASFKLVASTNTRSKFPNSVTSQLLTHDASVTGTGTATGSTLQGNAKATGTVIFANNGLQNVTIPTGTILTTGNGAVQFVVTASPVVPGHNSTVPIPVQAQNAGNEGNVGPNTITVVPASSIAMIAQASNLSTSDINLTVTNPGALTGGGATQAPAVTQNDLQNLKNSLHQQLQAQVKTWMQGQVPQGDIAGKLFPDVVGSAHPLSQEQLTQVPTVGSPLTSKTFQGTLSVNVSLLVVHRSNLIAAAQSQLNKAALDTRPSPYVLSTQLPVQLKVVSSSPSNDGTTITITVSASGLAMLQVDRQELSTFLAGKTKDQAISAISHGDAGPRGVENVDIEISPSFLTIMPFRSEHIHIDVMPGPLPKG
jgi:Baseplate J-like protein